MKTYFSFFTFSILLISVLKGQPQYITDIPGKSTNFTAYGSKIIFSSNDSLWVSDGTAEGTKLLKNDLLIPHKFIHIPPYVYFQAKAQFNSKDLWRTDGTVSGTIKIAQFKNAYAFTSFSGKNYFIANDSIHGDELWRTDGYTAELVKDFLQGPQSGLNYEQYRFPDREEMIANNEYLIFNARMSEGKFSLWSTDGTSGNCFEVFPHSTGPKICIENNLYFAHESLIYKTTGKADEIEIIVDLNIPPSEDGGLACYQGNFFRINNNIGLHMVCYTNPSSFEGYYINLKEKNYHLFYGTGDYDYPYNFINFDSLLFFQEGYEASYRRSFYLTDIQTLETKRTYTTPRNIDLSGSSGNFESGIKVKEYVFFTELSPEFSNTDYTNEELWQFELSSEETKIVREVFPEINISLRQSSDLTNVNDELFFTVKNSYYSGIKQLWRYDPENLVISGHYKNTKKNESSILYNSISNEIIISGDKESSELTVVSLEGKILMKVKNPSERIEFSSLNPGIYLIHYQDEKQVETFKLMKEQ